MNLTRKAIEIRFSGQRTLEREGLYLFRLPPHDTIAEKVNMKGPPIADTDSFSAFMALREYAS